MHSIFLFTSTPKSAILSFSHPKNVFVIVVLVNYFNKLNISIGPSGKLSFESSTFRFSTIVNKSSYVKCLVNIFLDFSQLSPL